jgi:hypothetical protein
LTRETVSLSQSQNVVTFDLICEENAVR